MKFTATVGEFLRALNLVGSVVPTKATIPILSHVLLKAMPDNRVSVVGTDMERECATDAQAEVEEIGSVTVPGSILKGIVSCLPKAGNLTLSIESGGRVSILSGRGRFAMSYLNAEDFPSVKPAEGQSLAIDAKKFRAILEATVGSASTEETRFYLCGVFLHVYDGALVAVSTDGHRMCFRSMDLPAGAEAGLAGVIIPTSSVNTLITLLEGCDGEVSAWITQARMWVQTPQATFSTALINGQYPDYRRVVPRYNGAAATVAGAELAAAIERAAETRPDAKAVGAGLSVSREGITITAGPAGAETAIEQIDAEYHADAEEVAANAKYLANMTKIWGNAPIDIHFTGRGAPLVFTSKALPEQTYIIMPMKR